MMVNAGTMGFVFLVAITVCSIDLLLFWIP